MDLLMLLPTFIFALLLLVCILLAVFHIRLGSDVYNIKIELGLLKVEVANLRAQMSPNGEESNEGVEGKDASSGRAHK